MSGEIGFVSGEWKIFRISGNKAIYLIPFIFMHYYI
jgi:hypothetical protein